MTSWVKQKRLCNVCGSCNHWDGAPRKHEPTPEGMGPQAVTIVPGQGGETVTGVRSLMTRTLIVKAKHNTRGCFLESDLVKAIRNKTARIVVIGLGYVGLPVACMFARVGFQVVGIRRNNEKIAQINRGICPIEGKEPGLPELLAEVIREGRLRATTDYAECRRAQIALVAVETPVDKTTKRPGYEALRATLQGLAHNLQPGTLVIIESTIAPRTMETVVKPILQEASGLKVNEDFYLANCPERVMPGKLLANIENCSRVVGGMSPETAQATVELYRYIV
ncbi:MAG TPA: hypothetical protein EYP49_04780, partial [Anaerolineae bacterium]|nr:hypothetical protein [Anaerolineae bacterium]